MEQRRSGAEEKDRLEFEMYFSPVTIRVISDKMLNLPKLVFLNHSTWTMTSQVLVDNGADLGITAGEW